MQNLPQVGQRPSPVRDEPISEVVDPLRNSGENCRSDCPRARSRDSLDRREGSGASPRRQAVVCLPWSAIAVRSAKEGGRNAEVVREEVTRAAEGDRKEAFGREADGNTVTIATSSYGPTRSCAM
eukprot:CAMPEP_0183301338 /NCGR_PEP_ID=MMETSP0160_2-20130417/7488_1 /TAXON_ID=2839 ORGANISM="Odontella Sinensis, Strain Grunow 1884" /NCGR_SAMPLE_ID=MMETSP0160_2 /ASSEMBLY_ACC=CAM_ASM_000250 /LENGTH=124 /DNA_ID=CAMNT_0025463937 /DNA_START=818 /DNA_END=1190 /DNA_ORIENTATION=+